MNKAEADFSFNLFRQVQSDGSSVISPVSVRLAFALAHLGARGFSRSEIVHALSGGIGDDEFLTFHTQLCRELNTKGARKCLKIANRAFFNKEFSIRPSFSKEIAERYAAEAVTLDFNDKNRVAETVNTFVNDATGGKINNLLAPVSVEDSIVAFLINAAYFDGYWKLQFYVTDTKEDDFYELENKTAKVQFMHQLGHFRYFENDKFQIVDLPYTRSDFSFVILLPKERRRCKLKQTFENFSGKEFSTCLSSMDWTEVQLKLPKMNIDTSVDLKEYLQQLGIKSVFDSSTADLFNMVEEKRGMMNPFIEKTIHKATIEVTESGTVATVGTFIQASTGSCLNPPPLRIIPFIADHPFIFWIMFKMKHILFIGKMSGKCLPSSDLIASRGRGSRRATVKDPRINCEVVFFR